MGEDIYLQNKIKNVLDIYSQVELDLIEVIINKLKLADGEIGGSLEWYLKRLNDLGGLNKETLKIISKYTGITQKELKSMLKTIGIDTIDALNLVEPYRKGEITINPKTFYKDIAITNLINNSYDNTLKTFLGINKNIVESARKQYVEILNTAYLEVSTGVYDYGTSIRKALNKFADAGISAATYKYEDGSTRTYNIEGIVRRDILTATHQLSGDIIGNVIEKTEPEYIHISEHYQARPTHEPWQGCIVKKEDFEPLTGYGEVDGIYGVNCKHFHYPYFGDIDKSKYKTVVGYYGGTYNVYTQMKEISKEENARLYELSQEQRALERNVRRWKRRQVVAQTDEDKKKANYKVDFWQHKLRNFTKDHKELRRDYLREKI